MGGASACLDVVWDPEDPRGLPHQFARMEWVGDAILFLLVSADLYARFPRETEGQLTARRMAVVSNRVLATAAEHLGLDRMLVCDRQKASQLGMRSAVARGQPQAKLEGAATKWKADAFEALLCAAYFEGGFAMAQHLFTTYLLEPVLRCGSSQFGYGASPPPADLTSLAADARGGGRAEWRAEATASATLQPDAATNGGGPCEQRGTTRPDAAASAQPAQLKRPLAAAEGDQRNSQTKHPKQLLNELVQASRLGALEFATVEDCGSKHPEPAKRFTVAAKVGGRTLALGCGSNTKQAGAAAAAQAVEVLKRELGS